MKHSTDSFISLILDQGPAIISLVGAGGKTTLLHYLANSLVCKRKRVMLTTTTRIFIPDTNQLPGFQLLIEEDPVSIIRQKGPESGLVVAAQGIEKETNKLLGYSTDGIDQLFQYSAFDFILVEADGAKQKPIKAPSKSEPVIPRRTSFVFGLIGMDCLGKSLEESICHRSNLFSALANRSIGNPIDFETIKSLVMSPQGLFQYAPESAKCLLVLNKADDIETIEAGKSFAQDLLKEKDFKNNLQGVVISSFRLNNHSKPSLDFSSYLQF